MSPSLTFRMSRRVIRRLSGWNGRSTHSGRQSPSGTATVSSTWTSSIRSDFTNRRVVRFASLEPSLQVSGQDRGVRLPGKGDKYVQTGNYRVQRGDLPGAGCVRAIECEPVKPE